MNPTNNEWHSNCLKCLLAYNVISLYFSHSVRYVSQCDFNVHFPDFQHLFMRLLAMMPLLCQVSVQNMSILEMIF